MKKRMMAWGLLLLMVLSLFSGCKQVDTAGQAATPGEEVVNAPAAEDPKQDTPTVVQPAETEQEDIAEQPEQKEEESVENKTEVPTEDNIQATEKTEKEIWFEDYLPQALETYDHTIIQGVDIYYIVTLKEFPNGAEMKEPMDPLPDFSMIEEIDRIKEQKNNATGIYNRRINLYQKTQNRELVKETLIKLNGLDFVERAELGTYVYSF